MARFWYRTQRRLFTQNGAFVGRNLPNILPAFVQAVRRKVSNRYPDMPWLSFSAVRAIDRLARKEWVAYEIGAGMSTVWLSRRVAHLISIEADQNWYSKLQNILECQNIHNVDLRLEWRGHLMSDYSAVPDESLDFLLVDGGPRAECFYNGFPKVRRGGYIYLDNIDHTNLWPGLDHFIEEQRSAITHITRFIDYSPAQVMVGEGWLIQKS
jgi:hypothetical protein